MFIKTVKIGLRDLNEMIDNVPVLARNVFDGYNEEYKEMTFGCRECILKLFENKKPNEPKE